MMNTVRFIMQIPVSQYDRLQREIGMAKYIDIGCRGTNFEVLKCYASECCSDSSLYLTAILGTSDRISTNRHEVYNMLSGMYLYLDGHQWIVESSIAINNKSSDSDVKPKTETYFDKLVINGPATIGFKGDKKYLVKRYDGDIDDPEKAFLMLVVKSKFDSDTEFHSWMKKNMKMMTAAYDLAASKPKKVKKAKDNTENKADTDTESTKSVFDIMTEFIEQPKQISGEEKCYARRVKLNDFKRCYTCTMKVGCLAKDDSRCNEPIVAEDQNGEHYTWTDSETDYLYKNYKTKTIREMANDLGRSAGSIRSKLFRLNLEAIPGNRGNSGKLSGQQINEIIDMYKAGFSRKEIAEGTGINKNTLNSVIFRYRKQGLIE